MSRKATPTDVESAFETLAANAGWETSELAEHVSEVFTESQDGGLMDGVNVEPETSEPETSEEPDVKVEEMAYDDMKELASKGVEQGVLAEYPGNAKDDLIDALQGNVADIEGESETADSSPETSESEGYNVPYGNTDSPNNPEEYEHPSAIMSREEIRNHPSYDGKTDVNKLMHYQGKHGVCTSCNLWASMAGDKCKKCDSGNGSSGGSNTSNDGLTVAKIQETFGVNAEEARQAKEAVENDLFGSVKDAIDA